MPLNKENKPDHAAEANEQPKSQPPVEKGWRLYLKLFATFFKIGAFTLGGGYAMLSLVEKSIVDDKHWIEEKDFWDMITLVQTLPGVFAVNTALYVGYRIAGMRGAISAMLGAVGPSLIIIIILAMFFSTMWKNPVVKSIFLGIRPCVVALMMAPALKMIKSVGLKASSMWIPIVALLAVSVFYVSPVYVILFFGLGGLVWGIASAHIMKKKGGEQC